MTQLLVHSERCEQQCIHPGVVEPILPDLLTGPGAAAATAWFATLADGSRLRILRALSIAPELCVCDLAFALAMSVSALSHQLAYLRERGIVRRRKVGRVAYYALADEHVRHVLADALEHLTETPASRPAATDNVA